MQISPSKTDDGGCQSAGGEIAYVTDHYCYYDVVLLLRMYAGITSNSAVAPLGLIHMVQQSTPYPCRVLPAGRSIASLASQLLAVEE